MQCILHIGTAKTGTTSLQAFLARNRNQLQQQGIYYPGPEPAQHFLMLPYRDQKFNYARQQDLNTPAKIQNHFQDCWNAARIDNPPAGTQTLLLSSEEMINLKFQDWIKVREQLSGRYSSIKLFVYLRRPDQWTQSFWISCHRYGDIPDFEIPPWSCRAPIQRCLDVFGAAALQIRLFDRERLVGGDIRDDFAQLLGMSTSGWIRPPVANESNSLEQLQLLRRLNRWLAAQHPDWQFSSMRHRITNMIDRQEHHTRVLFSREECAALLETYREDLDWIEQLTHNQGQPMAFDRSIDHLPIEGTWRRADEAPPGDLVEQVLWQVIEQFALNQAMQKASSADARPLTPMPVPVPEPHCSVPLRRLQVADLPRLDAEDASQLKLTPPALGHWQRAIPPAPKVKVNLNGLDGLLAPDLERLQSFPGFATAWPRLTQGSQTLYTVPRFLFRGPMHSTCWAQSADGDVIENLPYRGQLHQKRSLDHIQQWQQSSYQERQFSEIDQELFVIPGLQDIGYYHAMVNSFPTLTWYRELELNCPIFFPPEALNRFPIYSQILNAIFAWLGIPWGRLLDIQSTSPGIYRRAYIPAPIVRYDAHAGLFYHDLGMHLMQIRDTEDRHGTSPKRIYISRRDATRRPLLNEPELIEALSQQDFHCVDLSRLDFVDQVALMHNAELIVAPHGAGLSNIGFCRPGAMVVELLTFPTELIFLRPSVFKGLSYFPLACNLAPGCNPAPEKMNSPQSQWHVDIPRLLRVLERLDPLPFAANGGSDLVC